MRVVIYFAEGYEEIEALTVVDVLRRGGVNIIMAGIGGMNITSARGITVKMDTTIEVLEHDDVDMIILPGGMPGVSNLEKNDLVIKNIKSFKAQGKWLAAICAAPSIFGKNELLVNEKATCYPGYENSLKQCEYCSDKTVISHKIVTSQGAGTAMEFAFTLLAMIKGKEAAEQVRRAMLA